MKFKGTISTLQGLCLFEAPCYVSEGGHHVPRQSSFPSRLNKSALLARFSRSLITLAQLPWVLLAGSLFF